MKLKKVHAREFKSIMDSNEFDVADITCLVGKNEAGKTAILQALYRLNPIVPEHAQFNVTEDYPRTHMGDYVLDVEENRRAPAQVIEAWFALDEEEIAAVENEFGPRCLRGAGPHLQLSKSYSNSLTATVDVDEPQIVRNLIANVEFANEDLRMQAEQTTSLKALQRLLTADLEPHHEGSPPIQSDSNGGRGPEAADAEPHAERSATSTLLEKLAEYIDKGLHTHIYQTYLQDRVPRFL